MVGHSGGDNCATSRRIGTSRPLSLTEWGDMGGMGVRYFMVEDDATRWMKEVCRALTTARRSRSYLPKQVGSRILGIIGKRPAYWCALVVLPAGKALGTGRFGRATAAAFAHRV
eukprot:gene23015-biopygen13339